MPPSEQPFGDQASVPENLPGDEDGGLPPSAADRYASFDATTAPTLAARSPLTAANPS
ncbi:hypothetical protein [Actinomadura sp. WMMA1423]|uniref:hypothetical protein n=1 Tax=Actinomadura sp. WMMA1423 TaxID=2591108 RepID=UPI00143D2BA5|nr:hypothetical protein [Actinomadura sp. WMMA1423]